jgi:hypothetical protein
VRVRRATLVKAASYLALAAISALMLFPFAWMLASSFKPFTEIFAGRSFLPVQPTLANYASLFQQSDALRKVWNSLYIAALYTALAVFLCAMGGYAFAKFRFPGRGVLFGFLLATMAVPFAVTMVPLFIMMRNWFHWIDTPWPLIVPWAANAFGIFFMRQYMLSVPDDMLDADLPPHRPAGQQARPGEPCDPVLRSEVERLPLAAGGAPLRRGPDRPGDAQLAAGPAGPDRLRRAHGGLGGERAPDAPAVPAPPAPSGGRADRRRGQGVGGRCCTAPPTTTSTSPTSGSRTT